MPTKFNYKIGLRIDENFPGGSAHPYTSQDIIFEVPNSQELF